MCRYIFAIILVFFPIWLYNYMIEALPAAPADQVVPLPPQSAREHLEFPSDESWAGGPQYIVIDASTTFAEVPQNGWCEAMPYASDNANYWFACAWYDTERELYVRTEIVYQFAPELIHEAFEWEFNQATLTLHANVNTWHGFFDKILVGCLAILSWLMALLLFHDLLMPAKKQRS